MTSASRHRRTHRGMAARQALRLCEAELLSLTRSTQDGPGPPRIRAHTARAALRAAGLPPRLAAVLRSRLLLLPDQEARP
jgi:hypothetical protein